MKIKNTKQFNTKLTAIGKSATTLKDNIQDLCVFAFDQANQEFPNLSPATSLILKTKGIKAINSALLSAFLLTTIQNVTFVSKKDANGKETKSLKQVKDKKVQVAEVYGNWSDYTTAMAEDKPYTKLGKMSSDNISKTISKLSARLRVTDDVLTLKSHEQLLKGQLEIIQRRLKAVNEADLTEVSGSTDDTELQDATANKAQLIKAIEEEKEEKETKVA